ncbi:MAG TPA: DUF3046 domain-containing protein [Mycobacteriales bacterium]|nr:DUF3046 domain-containing protein [Mycobacteriales bacterium]
MRLSEFWWRMRQQFGELYAGSLARDHVFSELGGRTANDALEAGISPKRVWQAICAEFDVPVQSRH